MSNLLRLILSVTASVVMLSANAAETIVLDAANPPFMYDKNGSPAGVYPALFAAAFAKMGTDAKLEAKSWSNALAELDGGKVGVGGIYKNADRVKKFDFSEPIFVEKLIVYTNKSKPLAFKSANDLKGSVVGVIRGWSYGDDFDNVRKTGGVKVEEAADDAQNLEKLNAGRLDAVIAVEEAGTALLKTGAFPNVVASATPLATNAAHLAFNKAARKADLLAKFSATISQMKKSGEYAKVVDQALADGK